MRRDGEGLSSSPMSIVQVTSSRARSGGVVQAVLLTRGLVDAGHRVVFCAPARSHALRWAEEAGARAVAVDFGGLWRRWRSSRLLRLLAREEGAHLVHAHHTQGHNLALLATLGGGFPPVVANRGVLVRPEFPAKFRSARTAGIITNSEAVKGVLEGAGIPGAKIHVVYNAKEAPDLEELAMRLPELRRALGLAGEGPVIGAIGNGRPVKGLHHVVEASPQILARFPGATFVLVGGGVEHLRPRMVELGVEAHFCLPGHRSDAAEIAALFDVFVLPSLSESCPNALLEAVGVGVPAVCSDVGGVREILDRVGSGRLVPPAQPHAIAEAVCEVLTLGAQARTLGMAGRDALLREFSLARKVEDTLGVYRRILGRSVS